MPNVLPPVARLRIEAVTAVVAVAKEAAEVEAVEALAVAVAVETVSAPAECAPSARISSVLTSKI